MSRRRRRRQTAVSFDETPVRRWPTGWLLLGLLVGLGGGLIYAWLISPVVYTDASPARFDQPSRAAYLELVSQSYVATGDWEATQRRLALLEEENIEQTVSDALDAAIRTQRPDPTIRGLAALAQQLGVSGRTVALFAPTPATPIPSPSPTAVLSETTPTPTPTPLETAVPTAQPTETAVPTATSQPNFRLLSQERLCSGEPAHIEVTVLDPLLAPLPGVEVRVEWDAGSDRFFTGFKPERGLGFADFTMTPDISYTLFLPEGSPQISGLRTELCEDGTLGGWALTFQNLRR